MKSRVDPSALAESFVGAVTLAARELVERIEHVVHPHEPWSGQRRSEMLDATLTSMRFVLEATERIASAHLSPAEQEHFRLMVKTLTLEGESDEPRAAYRATLRNGSRLRVMAQSEGNSAGGTLLWEFAKSVCGQSNSMNSAAAAILSLVAANTFEALAAASEQSTECQMPPSETADCTSEKTELGSVEKYVGTYCKVVGFQERPSPDALVVLYLRPGGRFLFAGRSEGYERSSAAGQWMTNGAEIILDGYGQVLSGDTRARDKPFERVFTVEHTRDTVSLVASTVLEGWSLLGGNGPFMYVGQRAIIDPDGEWMPGSFDNIDAAIERVFKKQRSGPAHLRQIHRVSAHSLRPCRPR